MEAHYVELLRWFNVAWMHEIDSPEELARILRSRAPTRLADLPPKIRHRIGKEYQSAMADIALSHRKRVTLDRRIRALEHAEKVLGQLPYREQRRLEAMRRERAASKGAT